MGKLRKAYDWVKGLFRKKHPEHTPDIASTPTLEEAYKAQTFSHQPQHRTRSQTAGMRKRTAMSNLSPTPMVPRGGKVAERPKMEIPTGEALLRRSPKIMGRNSTDTEKTERQGQKARSNGRA